MKKILKHKYKIIGTILLVGLVAVILVVLNRNNDNNAVSAVEARPVKVSMIRDIIGLDSSLTLVGEVDSDQSVQIKTQLGGVVKNVSAGIGDYVNRGQTLAVFQNEDVYANVVQAEAGVRLQEARLNEIKSGARREEIVVTESKIKNTESNIESAKRTLSETLRDSFIKSDDIVNNKLSALFTGTDGYPQVSFLTNNFKTEIKVESSKSNINRIIEDWRIKNENLTTDSDLDTYTDYVKENLSTISMFLDDLAILVNDVYPSSNLSQATIDTYRTNLTASRSAIVASTNSTVSAKTSLDSLKSTLDQLKQELSIKQSGGTDNQLEAQIAILEQAKGSLLSARAAYNKTIISSPINGQVVSVSVKTGQYISPSQAVFKIVNNNGLYVKTYVNTKDVGQINVGDSVKIEGLTKNAFVSVISPGIDSDTGKVEVEITVPNEEKINLIEGEYVNIEINKNNSISNNKNIMLPMSSIKSSTSGSYVFVVNEEGRIEQLEVITGKTNGTEVEVISGINFDTEIVTNVRGLTLGDKVEVK